MALLPDDWNYEELVIGDPLLINEDFEGSGWPDAICELRGRVREADGLPIAIPENN